LSGRHDVAVVGAGVFGAWCAWTLAQRRRRVLLVEAWTPGHSRASSGDESRIARAGYGADALYTRMADASLAAWRGLEAGRGAGEPHLFHRSGVLWFSRAAGDRAEITAATLEAEGVPHERLSPAEIARRFPQFALDGIRWGLLEPEAGAVMARRSVAHVAARAVQAGAELVHGRVRAHEVEGGPPRLTLDGADLAADQVVLACGPWLPTLLPGLLAGRITPTRQEVFYLGAPGGDAAYSATALPAFVDFEAGIYAIPDLEGRGVKIGIDRHGPPCDPDTLERHADPALLAEARARLGQVLPGLAAAPLLESRVCQYENTASGDLLVDHHPADPRLWLVGGGSGHGFKHAPAVAAHLALRLLDGAPAEPRLSLAQKTRERRRAVY
jgi:glycine/D-amino acid oxidase-like deaminating enzyme